MNALGMFAQMSKISEYESHASRKQILAAIISDQNPLIIPTTNYTCSKTILIMYDNL